MLDAIKAYWTLRWTSQPQLRPLPPHITRHFVKTPAGDIELLIGEPQTPNSSQKSPAIFFIHGGYGHASIWLEFMTYLSQHYNGRTYAYSMRNHGASFHVPYFKMVWGTSLDELTQDLVAAIQEAQKLEQGRELILVGHSSGGGISQYILSKSLVKARALVLLGAIPHYGNFQVNMNWTTRIDPWFGLRHFFHFCHPTSALSTTRLVYNAFFGPEFSLKETAEFRRWMPNYESMWWPLSMGGRGWNFKNRTWLEATDILKNIVSWTGSTKNQDKIMVLIGTEDKLIRGTEERVVKEYRESIDQLVERKKLEFELSDEEPPVWQEMDRYVREQRAGGVRLAEVRNAGHHTQNDVQWREAAEALRRFAEQA